MKKNNKGFSLVELIIVIAIMAILIGVMAPQLIKYIEKSKVESDREMLNSIYTAIVYAIGDPKVSQDDDTQQFIDDMVASPQTLADLQTNAPVLYTEVLDTIGWTPTEYSNYISKISSAHTSASVIYMQFKGTCDNPIAMWIDHTDSDGKKDTSITVSNYSDPNISRVVSIY